LRNEPNHPKHIEETLRSTVTYRDDEEEEEEEEEDVVIDIDLDGGRVE